MIVSINEFRELSTVLYHWVSLEKIYDMLTNDRLLGNFVHEINGKKYRGNSLSRNKNLMIDVYIVRLSLDKSRLQKNYRIMPLDGEIIHRGLDVRAKGPALDKARDRNPRKTHAFNDQKIDPKESDRHRFDEEFLIGDINRISQYIKKIDVVKPKWTTKQVPDNTIEALENYAKEHNIPFNRI